MDAPTTAPTSEAARATGATPRPAAPPRARAAAPAAAAAAAAEAASGGLESSATFSRTSASDSRNSSLSDGDAASAAVVANLLGSANLPVDVVERIRENAKQALKGPLDLSVEALIVHEGDTPT